MLVSQQNTHNSDKNNGDKKPVVCVLVYNDLSLFEYAQAVEVFAKRRPEIKNWYETKIIAIEPGEIRAQGNAIIKAQYNLTALSSANLVIIPGWRGINSTIPAELKQALLEANANGVKIASICSGVYVLAQAGLLKGKKVTTHWKYSEEFQKAYPDIELDKNVLYVDEGDVLTSAGSAAGLDLALHIVRKDFGAETANSVARGLVVAAHRDGSQAQYIARPVEIPFKGNIAILLDIVRENLDKDWSIEQLAETAKTSPRTLQRRFRAATGQSPHGWLTRERIELVKDLLETTDMNIQSIAEISGLKTPETLRHHFKRLTGISPTRFRRQFKQI